MNLFTAELMPYGILMASTVLYCLGLGLFVFILDIVCAFIVNKLHFLDSLLCYCNY